MWISKNKWNETQEQIRRIEERINKMPEDTDRRIRSTAKRILEQPDELLEEIRDIENIEQMVDEFIRS